MGTRWMESRWLWRRGLEADQRLNLVEARALHLFSPFHSACSAELPDEMGTLVWRGLLIFSPRRRARVVSHQRREVQALRCPGTATAQTPELVAMTSSAKGMLDTVAISSLDGLLAKKLRDLGVGLKNAQDDLESM